MTSIARALRITSGSLGVALLVLTVGPHSVARAQHGAQIEKSCVNAARRACLQGTTPGCPGVNAGVTCQTAADCPGGECTSCVPIPIARVGDPIACTITVTSVDPVDRIRLDTVTDEISSRSPIVPTANQL